MMDPEDYKGGVEEMINDTSGDPYDGLIPLGQRKTTEIKVKAGDSATEADLALKFGYSQPIALLFKMTQKMYGYMRDANITDPLELAACKGANALNDIIFDADCLNRQGRYDDEEKRAQQWQKLIIPREKDEDSPDIDDLLEQWSEADAFMLQAQIVEERDGIDAAVSLYPKFTKMKKQRDDVQMKASELPPAENMLFWCRVRQYKIMRERAYDLALGYPTHDFTDVKRKLATGENIHDLIPEMAWPWRESYQLVMGSTADGESWRTTLMAMYAQELPRPPTQPWGMPPGYFPPYMNGNGSGEEEGEEQPDNRRPLLGLFGGNKQQPQEPEPKKTRRRARGKR